MEATALKSIRDYAPEYSCLREEWSGDDPSSWRVRIKKTSSGMITDL